MSRELGTALSVCPRCDTQLRSKAQEDGSVAVASCPSCHPSPEKASRTESPAREHGEHEKPKSKPKTEKKD